MQPPWTEIPRLAKRQSREGDLILLLRHSRRHQIGAATMDAAFGAQLTDEGRGLAREFGQTLDVTKPIRFFHSPVPRCEDTARCMAEGVTDQGGESHIVGAREFLGADFIKDGDQIVKIFTTVGLRGFMELWFRGAIDSELIDDPQQAGRGILLKLIGEHIPGEESPLDVHITHDLGVLTLLGLFCEVSSPDFPWPDFLDGVVLCLGKERISWQFQDRKGEISLATIKGWHLR